MELIKLRIPYDFVAQRARLSWRELLYGIENELIDQEAGIDFASNDVAMQEAPSITLLELAGTPAGDPTRVLVEKLANAEPTQAEERIRDKWLYLVLAWLFEEKANHPDPLRAVEEVYADFGYPKRIAAFVRYMPMAGPDLGDRALNEGRLYDKWREYLEESAVEFAREETK